MNKQGHEANLTLSERHFQAKIWRNLTLKEQMDEII
jgi:hypothetical protein